MRTWAHSYVYSDLSLLIINYFLEKRWMAFNVEECLSLSYAYWGFQELFQTFKAALTCNDFVVMMRGMGILVMVVVVAGLTVIVVSSSKVLLKELYSHFLFSGSDSVEAFWSITMAMCTKVNLTTTWCVGREQCSTEMEGNMSATGRRDRLVSQWQRV